MDIRDRLIVLSIIKKGNWLQMYRILQQDPQLSSMDNEVILNQFNQTKGIKTLTIVDGNYPKCLKEMEQPPFVLFYQGDLNLLSEQKVGVIGTRRPSTYGMKSCQSMVSQLLMENIVIVGGLQLGIDSIAHLISSRKGRTIAVLASGFYQIYPYENYDLYRSIAKEHLVISEYPPHVKVEASQFHFRNRLITAISDVLMVIEVSKTTAMLQVAKRALYDGKVIYALPGEYNSLHSEGSLELIKEGAQCLTDSNDILQELSLISH